MNGIFHRNTHGAEDRVILRHIFAPILGSSSTLLTPMVLRHEKPIGADVNSGAVHSVTVTAANTADIMELPKLLREDDQVILADAGYSCDD